MGADDRQLFSCSGNRILKGIRWQQNCHLYLLALVKFLMHIAAGWQYGYFRDEFYYFAMSDHPAFGYVDVSPIVPSIMRLSRLLFGDSVQAIHIFPAIAGAVTIVFAGLTARRLGGGRFAETLAAIAVLAAPVFQAFNSAFTYDCFDQLMSAIFLYLAVCMLKTEEPSKKQWITLGIAAGIGLMVKISFLFLGFCFVAALLLTKRRKLFASKWLWIAGAIALALTLPFIIWQIQNGGIILEYWGQYASGKTFEASPLEFLLMEAVVLNPLNLPLWAVGLYFFLFGKNGKGFRVLGLTHLIFLALAMLISLKYYMPAGTFICVLAGGAVSAERLLGQAKRKAIKPVYASLLLLSGILLLPLSVPVLPIEQYLKLDRIVSPLTGQVRGENHELAELPQHFADRFGWEELVKTVSGVYHELPPAEREKCAILAGNYGEAGAIDLFGGEYGLPKSISGHLSYYVWGPRGYTGELMILVGLGYDTEQELEELFEDVQIRAVTYGEYAIPYENNNPVFLCRGLKLPMQDAWPLVKNMG